MYISASTVVKCPILIKIENSLHKEPYTLSAEFSDYTCDVIPDGKLSKLHSFDRKYHRPQNCPLQSSFTQRTVHFTQGITQFPQFSYRH